MEAGGKNFLEGEKVGTETLRVGRCLVCSKNSKEVSIAGAEWIGKKVVDYVM